MPGIAYECRTGPDASFTTTTPAWVNCDGASGTGRVATLAPTPSTPEGNYRTEVRYRQGTFTSAVVAARYYIHHSLDKVATCPRPGFAADGPHFTDADYFNAATTFATANPTLFPLSAAFPAPAAIPARTDAIYLRNPFIKIPFVGVTESGGMTNFGTGLPTSWPSTGGSYLFNERSLRHAWVINAAHTMILMKRRYAHPVNTVAPCQNLIWEGHPFAGTDYPYRPVDCEALVLNSHGNGLCFTTGGAAPIPVANEAPAVGVGHGLGDVGRSWPSSAPAPTSSARGTRPSRSRPVPGAGTRSRRRRCRRRPQSPSPARSSGPPEPGKPTGGPRRPPPRTTTSRPGSRRCTPTRTTTRPA